MTDLLTTREAANALGFKTTQTFLRWAKRVGFPLVRLSPRNIRVRRTDVEEEIERAEADSSALSRTIED